MSEFQECTIGALLVGGLTADANDVLATLPVEAFSVHCYRECYKTIQAQAREIGMIDPMLVAEEVEKLNRDYFSAVMQLFKNTPSAANLRGYALRTAQEYERHQVIELIDGLHDDLVNGTIQQATEAVRTLQAKLSTICKPRTQVEPVMMSELLDGYVELLDKRMANGDESDTIKTGIVDLDRITGGMNPEDLVVVAARPGMGKTELALRIAEGAASKPIPESMAQNEDHQRHVLIFSLEMSNMQLVERSVAGAGNLPVNVLRTPSTMQDEDWARVSTGIAALTNLKIAMVDASALTIEEIAATATRYKNKYPNLSLIMIDYLGLIQKPQAERNDLAIAHISGSMKGLAKKLRTPVISLSQLSRDVEKRADKRPTNADLRDSGAIEQDADCIIMLYRDAVYNENSPAAKFGEIIVTKNRFGELGTVYQEFKNGHFHDTDQNAAREICTRTSSQPSRRGADV